MSSYSQITFADYQVFENKNWYYKEVVSLIFQPEDFVIEKRKYSTRNKIVWGDAYENEAGYFEFKGFRQSVKVCKQRLEIYGNSSKKAKEDFASAKRLAKQEYHYEFSFRGITYNEYLLEIRDIITSKQKDYNYLYTSLRKSLITDELPL